MGYDNRYTGEITITPPLTWGQLRDADAPKIADDGASSWESAIADCAREADYQTPAEAIAGLLGRF